MSNADAERLAIHPNLADDMADWVRRMRKRARELGLRSAEEIEAYGERAATAYGERDEAWMKLCCEVVVLQEMSAMAWAGELNPHPTKPGYFTRGRNMDARQP